jgi:4-hydroxy-3-methylbut-2-enyl diphosphate reductase
VRHLAEEMRRRFVGAEVRFVDTVCRPTKDRQEAAVVLARRSDVVLVVGGAHSNNTRELVATCRKHCPRVHHLQSADEICSEWLENAEVIGITAGTSTPDDVIDEVEAQVRTLAHAESRSHELAMAGETRFP